jgi:hypothetical protein
MSPWVYPSFLDWESSINTIEAGTCLSPAVGGLDYLINTTEDNYLSALVLAVGGDWN